MEPIIAAMMVLMLVLAASARWATRPLGDPPYRPLIFFLYALVFAILVTVILFQVFLPTYGP